MQGGAVAVTYASLFPAQVDRLVLLAPAGLLDEMPVLGRVSSLPLLQELLVHTGIASWLMKRASNANFYLPVLQDPHERRIYARHEARRRLHHAVAGGGANGGDGDDYADGANGALAADKDQENALTRVEREVVEALEDVRQLVRLNRFQIDHHPGMVRSFFSTTRHFPFTRHSKIRQHFEALRSFHKPIHVLWVGTLVVWWWGWLSHSLSLFGHCVDDNGNNNNNNPLTPTSYHPPPPHARRELTTS